MRCRGLKPNSVFAVAEPGSVQTINAHSYEILACDWNKYNEHVLVSGSVDKTLKIWVGSLAVHCVVCDPVGGRICEPQRTRSAPCVATTTQSEGSSSRLIRKLCWRLVLSAQPLPDRPAGQLTDWVQRHVDEYLGHRK